MISAEDTKIETSTGTATTLARVLLGASRYLAREAVCVEDQVSHNGRRAYVWTLLRWLHEHDVPEESAQHPTSVSKQLLDSFFRNEHGALVIYPGIHGPRNYSTNAIDCGIFVDAFHDYATLWPEAARAHLGSIEEVVRTYLIPKISSPTLIHNQYLWAATGLARWLRFNHGSVPDAVPLRELLESTLDTWLTFNRADGSASYSSTKRGGSAEGVTTYYHSRCLAFAWYILEHADIDRPDIEARLLQGGQFLAKMILADGTKQLCLETKRYYFTGTFEAGSLPYDIYVYSKAYERTGDKNWQTLAQRSFRWIQRSQRSDGALQSHPGRSLDWQCDTMRTGHLAWLTRVAASSLAVLHDSELAAVPNPGRLSTPCSSSSIQVVGYGMTWTHFVSHKSPLDGHAGQRASGLILDRVINVNDITAPLALQYRFRANWCATIPSVAPNVVADLKHSILHARDCLLFKRNAPQAWAFIRDNLWGWFRTAIGVVSTEFCCDIEGLSLGKDQISHDLHACDVKGKNKRRIGHRIIDWSEKGLRVRDDLTDLPTWPVRLPPGWQSTGESVTNGWVAIRDVGTVEYSGGLSHLESATR